MTIVAKYPSKCACCGGAIRAGEQIEWAKGSPSRHVVCDAAAPVPSPVASIAGRSITVERVGRRWYLRGDTLAVRGLLRGGGCHWDADARAWWIGDHAAAVALAASATTAPAEAAPKKRITHCVGCGCGLDDFAIRRGFKFCSKDCANDMRLGGQSGYVNGQWHQGSDD